MGTLIGASANVCMAGIAERAGYHVSFIDFTKIGFPVMLFCVVIATLWLLFLDRVAVRPPHLPNTCSQHLMVSERSISLARAWPTDEI